MATYTRLLTSQQMATCDRYTIETLGIPSRVLMERAATGVVDYMKAHEEVFPLSGKHIAVLCGSGNNGGDGFAVARLLSAIPDVKVSVCYVGARLSDGSPDLSRMSLECRRQYELVRAVLLPVFAPTHMISVLSGVDAVVDAMLGIGLDRPVKDDLQELIRLVNASSLPILAVDIPTGVSANTGEILGCAIQATATVTMQALKLGMLLYPAAENCGHIFIHDIGVDLTPADECKYFLADQRLLSKVMSPRARRSHKGTYGRLALVCGSEDMCGAVILAARGALRSGVGLLQVVTPVCNKTAINTSVPEALVTAYTPSLCPDSRLIREISGCDGVVIGCGLGTDQQALALFSCLLDALPIREDLPVILDADALNLLAKHPHLWDSRLLTEGHGQVIITPHPAELSRLSGASVHDILSAPLTHATAFAQGRGITVVCKDAHTVVADASGEVWICPYGNAGMATGGSGDVLAGILGSLAVQNRHRLGDNLSLCKIAGAGVALHSLSGDAAAELYGEYALTPSDVADAIGGVTLGLSDTRSVLD